MEVAEKGEIPILLSKNIPCDIIASKDGVIKNMTIKAGNELVKIGETVTKGQVLISGIIQSKNEKIESRQVHAIGSIKARTWYESSCIINIKIKQTVKTGDKKNLYSFGIFNKKIDLFHTKIKFNDYERISIKKRFSFFNDLVLPFDFYINSIYENKTNQKEITFEEAYINALKDAEKDALKNISNDFEIINKNISLYESADGIKNVRIIIECDEEIGHEKEIKE